MPAPPQPQASQWNSEPNLNYAPAPKINAQAVPYEMHELEMVEAASDEFLLAKNKGRVKAQIYNVLETESPISRTLLCKRVLQAWNISRLGTRIINHFDALFAQMKLNTSTYGDRIFYWKLGQYSKAYTLYRVPVSDTHKRDAEDLPPEEIANAIKEMLQNQISLVEGDLIKETSRIFGYARIGVNVENAIRLGIDYAISRGFARRDNGRIVLG